MSDEKVIDIREKRKPIVIDSPTSRLLLGNFMLWLIRLHKKSLPDDWCSEEAMEMYCKCGADREELKQIVRYLKEILNETGSDVQAPA